MSTSLIRKNSENNLLKFSGKIINHAIGKQVKITKNKTGTILLILLSKNFKKENFPCLNNSLKIIELIM